MFTAAIRGKFNALCVYMKTERFQINKLSFHLKKLKKDMKQKGSYKKD